MNTIFLIFLHFTLMITGMFSPSLGQSSYNIFQGNNGDYNTWSSQSINSASAGQTRKGSQYNDYYRDGTYPPHDGIKVITISITVL